MTTDRIADLFRVTPHRILCLILSAPAFWGLWLAVDRTPAKAALLGLALLWLLAIARTWSWYAKPRRKAGEISGARQPGLY